MSNFIIRAVVYSDFIPFDLLRIRDAIYIIFTLLRYNPWFFHGVDLLFCFRLNKNARWFQCRFGTGSNELSQAERGKYLQSASLVLDVMMLTDTEGV